MIFRSFIHIAVISARWFRRDENEYTLNIVQGLCHAAICPSMEIMNIPSDSYILELRRNDTGQSISIVMMISAFSAGWSTGLVQSADVLVERLRNQVDIHSIHDIE